MGSERGTEVMNAVKIPILGVGAAGRPIRAAENKDGFFLYGALGAAGEKGTNQQIRLPPENHTPGYCRGDSETHQDLGLLGGLYPHPFLLMRYG